VVWVVFAVGPPVRLVIFVVPFGVVCEALSRAARTSSSGNYLR